MKSIEKNELLSLLQSYKLIGFSYLDDITISKKLELALPNKHLELKEHIEHCSLCNLTYNKRLFGFGNEDANIYI